MAISVKELERLGIRERPEVIERLIMEAMADLLGEMRPMDPSQDLTAAEKDALRRGGLVLEEVDLGSNDPLLRTAVDYSALVASSLTVPQVAEMLGLDESRIRHRLAARALYGIKLRGGWRLPVFQFHAGQPLPSIEQVLPHLPLDLHPLEVLNWFTLPNPDLVVGEEEKPVSPRAWLLGGRNPRVVAELAEEL